MSEIYGRENLMGLGLNWTGDSLDYVIALKDGMIAGADFETVLPDEWTGASG